MRRRLALLGVLLACGSAAAEEPTGPRYAELASSDRFVVYGRREEVKDGVIVEGTGPRILAAIEKTRATVTGLGFRDPSAKEPVLVYVKKFVNRTKAAGLCLGKNRIAIDATVTGDRGDLDTVPCHELFHSVQYAYRLPEESWIQEGTANWAESLVFPKSPTVHGMEVVYLSNFHMSPMHRQRNEQGSYVLDSGRPYGTSVLFRFLEAARPGLVREVFEALDDGRSDDPLEAIGLVLGDVGDDPAADAAAFGPRFRSTYLRFVVGAFLSDEAPLGTRFPGRRLNRAPRDVWGPPMRYYAESYVKDRAAPHVTKSLSVGGLGSAGGEFAPTQEAPLPDGTSVVASVTAGRDEVGVQALVRQGGAWRVTGAAWDATSGEHRVTIPSFEKVKEAIVAVTRFDRAIPEKLYTVALRYSSSEHFEIDLDETMKRMRRKTPPPADADPEMEKLAERFARQLLGKLAFTLEGDGTATFLAPGGKRIVGPYRSDATSVTVEGMDDGVKKTVVGKREGDDVLVFEDGEQVLVFRRR